MCDRRGIRLLSTLLPVLLAGCVIVGGFIWEKRTYTGVLAWSDDGMRVLGAEMQHEQTANADPPIISGRARNYRYQLFIRNPDGSGTQYVGAERAGNLAEAFYMKQAGYVLAREHTAFREITRFVQFNLANGAAHVVWEIREPTYDGFHRLVPSRDGRVLAQCRLSEIGIVDAKATVLVTLLNAQSLQPLRTVRVPMRCESPSGLEVQWLPDGRLRVTCYAQRDAAIVAPDGIVQRAPVPREIGPATSGTQRNAKGQVLNGFKPDGSVDVWNLQQQRQ